MALLKFTTYTAFTLSLTGLALYRKHLVSALLCLEGLMISLFTTLATISQTLATATTMTQPIIMLTLSACEAGAGLGILVASSRTHASDHMKNLNLLKC
uniref:NADH-ubiquinone oxidoreductase chain 4L n=1 Tax=Cyrtopodion scabrum TaxID=303590 RepID=A0A1Y1CC40_CYRSA|nr:NADH dehydrogenase subunit 4L [Cyrtopodion scabrum]BAX77918.1 HADH dehydrogenase 4L [Cyrtopodion scabrum]